MTLCTLLMPALMVGMKADRRVEKTSSERGLLNFFLAKMANVDPDVIVVSMPLHVLLTVNVIIGYLRSL